MSEMVERVARGICHSRCYREVHVCDQGEDGACLPSKCRSWHLYEDDARAAIAAMREPTEAMHAAGNDMMDDIERGNGVAFAEHVYAAMIDEALR